jgi:5'(3')-deoxyribonucleotidase
MRLGIDIDSTIRQFAEDSIYKWNLEYKDCQIDNGINCFSRKMVINDWADYDYFYKVCGGRDKAFAWWIQNEVFRHAPVMTGARESLLDLHRSGHDIVIISKQTRHSHPEAARQTTEWLYSNRIYYDELHYCNNKTVVDVDVLIDDNAKLIEEFALHNAKDSNKFAILLRYPWSCHFNIKELQTITSCCIYEVMEGSNYWKNIVTVINHLQKQGELTK